MVHDISDSLFLCAVVFLCAAVSKCAEETALAGKLAMMAAWKPPAQAPLHGLNEEMLYRRWRMVPDVQVCSIPLDSTIVKVLEDAGLACKGARCWSIFCALKNLRCVAEHSCWMHLSPKTDAAARARCKYTSVSR
jgi:hypothetical protein